MTDLTLLKVFFFFAYFALPVTSLTLPGPDLDTQVLVWYSKCTQKNKVMIVKLDKHEKKQIAQLLLLKTFQTKCKSCLEVHFGMQTNLRIVTFQVYTP